VDYEYCSLAALSPGPPHAPFFFFCLILTTTYITLLPSHILFFPPYIGKFLPLRYNKTFPMFFVPVCPQSQEFWRFWYTSFDLLSVHSPSSYLIFKVFPPLLNSLFRLRNSVIAGPRPVEGFTPYQFVFETFRAGRTNPVSPLLTMFLLRDVLTKDSSLFGFFFLPRLTFFQVNYLLISPPPLEPLLFRPLSPAPPASTHLRTVAEGCLLSLLTRSP